MNEHVLLVFPHPDDEVFFCSGTVMDFVQKKIPITYVCLTLGEMGRGLGGANRQTLPQLRKKELEASCKVIGIDDLRLWGYRDKTIEFEDSKVIIKQLQEIIDEIHPSLIFTFYPGQSVHPDHDATGALVVEAVHRLPVANRPLIYGSAVFRETVQGVGEPDIIHDVTPYLEQKIACLRAYPSQFSQQIKDVELKDTKIIKRMMVERFWILNRVNYV
jgi:bacillithiol biosynthesis deacetylase BshB2